MSRSIISRTAPRMRWSLALLAPAQREVGERWQLGRYTITQEHVVSGVVDDVLGLLAIRTRPAVEHGNTLAMVCAEGEWHSTPARMAAIMAQEAGWRVQFLGASTPVDHLRTTMPQLAPQALAISCTLPLALAGVPRLVEAAHDLELPVIVGGRAFDPEGRRAATLGADQAFTDMRSATRTLERWHDHPPTLAVPVRDADLVFQRSVFADRRVEIIEDVYTALERRLPAVAAFDERQRRHTREDLDYLIRFVDITLLLEDPTIFTEFTAWLAQLLTSRGLPTSVTVATVRILREVVGRDLPAAHDLFTHAIAQLEDERERSTEGLRSTQPGQQHPPSRP